MVPLELIRKILRKISYRLLKSGNFSGLLVKTAEQKSNNNTESERKKDKKKKKKSKLFVHKCIEMR